VVDFSRELTDKVQIFLFSLVQWAQCKILPNTVYFFSACILVGKSCSSPVSQSQERLENIRKMPSSALTIMLPDSGAAENKA
jgi:hypothetical protein